MCGFRKMELYRDYNINHHFPEAINFSEISFRAIVSLRFCRHPQLKKMKVYLTKIEV